MPYDVWQKQHHLLLQEQLMLRCRLHVFALCSQLELQLLRALAVELCSSSYNRFCVGCERAQGLGVHTCGLLCAGAGVLQLRHDCSVRVK
jgi:hypothetical protein